MKQDICVGIDGSKDRLDAAIIAHFAEAVRPPPRPVAAAEAVALGERVTRRRQVILMMVAERNRARLVRQNRIQKAIERHLAPEADPGVQSYQNVSRETVWYDLGQKPYKAAYIQRLENCVRSRGEQNAWRDGPRRSDTAVAQPQRTSCPGCRSPRSA